MQTCLAPIYTIPPEETLARMLKDDLSIEISPQALRMFIRFRWETISKLAHDIHGTPLARSPTPEEYRDEVIKRELDREAKRQTLDPDEIARRYRAGEFDPL